MYFRAMKRGVGERINKGAALLDRKCPNWHEEIDLSRLDLSCTENCILGQLYGGFTTGVRQVLWRPFFWPQLKPADFGFMALCKTGRDTDLEFSLLKERWTELVLSRRQVARAA
jgi:hypothetical protein